MTRVNKDDYNYEVIEFLGSVKESPSSDWSKSVARISWNDNQPSIDIRNMNISKEIMGKGISLSDEEADALVDLLLNEDYGSISALQNALEKRQKRFDYNYDNKLRINIE